MTTTTASPVLPRPTSPMDLLSRGVPLSLLLDLVLGPNSQDLLDAERPARTAS